MHRVARRRERAPDAADVLAQIAQPLADLLRRFVADHVLEFVDLVIEVVDQIEVALRDRVDEVVDEHAHLLMRPAGLLRGFRVERLLARRRLGDRHEGVLGRDEVDLLVVDAVLLGHRDGEQEDSEHVIAV